MIKKLILAVFVYASVSPIHYRMNVCGYANKHTHLDMHVN